MRPAADGQSLPQRFLSGELPGATDCLALLSRPFFRGLFVGASALHLSKEPFALELPLQSLEGLINVVIADKYSHTVSSPGVR
jgi:hypothetical protein